LNNNSNIRMNTFSRTTFFVDENNQITTTMLNFMFNMNFLQIFFLKNRKKQRSKKNINTTSRRNSCKEQNTIKNSNIKPSTKK
jgi:hypothetical protein